MGFSRQQIVREFAGIFARFGFDEREEVLVDQREGVAGGSRSSTYDKSRFEPARSACAALKSPPSDPFLRKETEYR
jgi:hypothetical protein